MKYAWMILALAGIAPAMTQAATPDSPASNSQVEALRAKNRATVERFFQLPIGNERAALYADDGVKELVEVDWKWEGKAAIQANTEGNVAMFPGWRWFDTRIDATTDPNKFWVETDGAGKHVIAPGSNPVPNGAHYVISFEMRDGKIARMREFRIPVKRECQTLALTC